MRLSKLSFNDLKSLFVGGQSLARYYIVSTRRERHAKYPRMVRHSSRAKSAKRARRKAKRRGL